MSSQINLVAILIANIMGITILFCVAVCSFRTSSKLSSGDRRILLVMWIASLVSCIADPICFMSDGKPGLISRILVIGGNTLVFLGYIIVALEWVFLIANHLSIKLSKTHKCFLFCLSILAVAVLIVNLFTPVIFVVNADNVYSRTGIQSFYLLIHLTFVVDGLILYFYARHKSGNVKFFPAWAFILPATIGSLIQWMMYGVSTITPFITVAISCIVSCLQNEFLNKDKLTGLYNRFYLDQFGEKIARNRPDQYIIMMVDINDFKAINDTYGHKIGDRALVEVADILRKTVGVNGEVIRYAGDEFFIILYSWNEEQAQALIADINEAFRGFRLQCGNPYEISVAIGYCRLNLSEETMEALFDKVDKHMYENKHEYYLHQKNGSRIIRN